MDHLTDAMNARVEAWIRMTSPLYQSSYVMGEIVSFVERVIRVYDTSRANPGKLLFAGNGGSAADAQHIAAEYVGIGMAALALTTDTSVLTALANDSGYEYVFVDQFGVLAGQRDLLIMHSTSGRSANLLNVAQCAQELGVPTVALLAGDGGPLKALVDQAIVIKTDDGMIAQEVHMAIEHVVFMEVMRRMNRQWTHKLRST